jgi:hypothetical protein
VQRIRHPLVTLAFAAAVARPSVALPGEAPPVTSDAVTIEEARGEAPGPAAAGRAPEQAPGAASDAAEPSVIPASAPAGAARVEPVPVAGSPRPAVAAVPVQPLPPSSPPVPPAESPAPVRGTRIDLPLEVEVHGRLFAGIGADERDGWTRRLDLDSARIEIAARLPGVLTVLEADVASQTPIKDAFARIDGPFATRLQAGRFKAPFSARQLESSWKLPLVDRGLVDGYVVKDNELGGRRLGATAAVRPWKGRLEVAGGVFAGERNAFGGEHRAQDLAAHVVGRPWKPLELGVTGYRAGSSEALVPVTYAASAYAQLSRGPIDAALEGFAGKVAAGDFTAATALVGWKVGAGGARRLRVTPIAGGEVLELRGASGGVGYSATIGAVLSWAEGLKVKLQGERARRPGEDTPGNALAMQLATRF